MSAKKKMTFSISTWFCLPEQGMMDMEILCRSSAFAVKSVSDKFPSNLHFITTSHNIAPWRFRNHYPEEWLQMINEKNTYYTIETRQPDGNFMSQSELLPSSFHHRSRDLAVLHLEKDHDELFDKLEIFPHILSDRELKTGDNLTFDGFNMSETSAASEYGTDNGSGELDSRRPVPSVVSGTFVSESMFRRYAKTAAPLSLSMSGAPVLCKPTKPAQVKSGRSAASVGGDRLEVCGMVENMIPDDWEEESLRGLAAFVDADTIAE
jgi:hypothetical protein